jgi:hypothetical protein
MGSQLRAVASIDTAREPFRSQKYLDSMKKLDREQNQFHTCSRYGSRCMRRNSAIDL